MVTSPPQSPSRRKLKNYPLFSKLLHEGLTSRKNSDQKTQLECPSTAPVLGTYSNTSDTPQFRDFYKKMEKTGEEESTTTVESCPETVEIIPPITLQDPPKSKLKRQLSVDTKESQEQGRLYKKPHLCQTSSFGRQTASLIGDEVDGSDPIATKTTQGVSQPYYRESRTLCPPPRLDISPSRQYSLHEAEQAVTSDGSSTTTLKRQCHTDIPIKSPNLFDLNDIGLTSPFMNTTPRGTSKTKEVFIYPESVSPRPRKPSPYKQTTDIGHGSQSHLYERERDRAAVSEAKLPGVLYKATENLARDMFPDEIKRQSTLTAQEAEPAPRETTEASRGSKYVSSKGFDWPLNVTITQAIPFSPRVVTTEARPRYSTATSSSSYPSPQSSSRQTARSDSYEEDVAKLKRLEREYKRALEIFGSPDAFRTHVLRSFSAVDKSPNEKSIRETREDVRNKYERMFSFPVAAPRLSHYFPQQPQRDDSLTCSHMEQELRFQQHRPWLSDARRRLFARSDSIYSHEGRDPLYEPDSAKSHGSTDIPEEVLQFLHSKNFHPEELENLKDFLRRGGSSSSIDPQGPSYLRMNPLSLDPQADGHNLSMYEREQNYRRSLSYEQHFGPVRDRRRGDIDVRLSCESVVPTKSTQEMLQDLEHDSTDCRCSKIEDAIRQMALQAYSKIRRTDSSPASFTQFQNEITETNLHVYESMQFLCGVKCLCKYGRTLEEVYNGSVVFRLHCPNIDALVDLWQEYKSGKLLQQLQKYFVTEELKNYFGCEAIKLSVLISKEDYYTCKTELEAALYNQLRSSPKKSPGSAIFHARSRSEPASVTKQANQLLTPKKKVLSPFRERFCSDSSVELSPRRAFQEINVSKDAIPLASPSKKHDNVFFNEEGALTSPKRHQFPSTSPQGEQENVGQSGSMVHSPRQVAFPNLPWSDNRGDRVTNV